ncbi:hypothetical protein KFU94_27565 [Chloroflexi bacterium TSY]|nr:hypothetical protein [Chloroflexi bacterium TSY]
MNKILAITWKELYTTFRNRNLLLLMFATPIVLSTIMGLAFGGLGGDSNSSAFADIPVAIVNLDEGFNLDEQLAADAEASGESFDGQIPSLNELEFEIGGETINVGEQLQLNPNLTITDSDLSADNASFNFGKQLVDILRPQAITTTDSATETTALSINLDDLSCPLLAEDDDEEPPFGFEGTLDDLLNTVELDDPEAARAGVENGEYAVAIIIPAGFTNQIMPSFNFGAEGNVEDDTNHVVIEIYGDQGQSISLHASALRWMPFSTPHLTPLSPS